MVSQRSRRLGHAAVIALALVPLCGLVLGALRGTLGANPVETITHVTGEWALRLLLATLAITPLRRAAGWSFIAPWRRSLGLLTFLYATRTANRLFGRTTFRRTKSVCGGEDQRRCSHQKDVS
jgi:DMSO/TMAO reductase YedYZ heme-binding membrane subunit